MDMKARLAEERKQRADKARPSGGSVDLNPKARVKKEKVEEPLPPDIDTVPGLSVMMVRTLKALVTDHIRVGKDERVAAKRKKELTDSIKSIIKDEPDLHSVVCADGVINFYAVARSTIKKEKLLEHGISAGVIAECTDESTSMTLKIRGLDEIGEE